MERIPLGEDGKQKSRLCKVCNKAEKLIPERSGAPPKKKYGSVTIYQCKQYKVELCARLCFELFHTQKDYIKKCIDLKQ